jgi:tRNA U54 and U55 pseudouridine synthase Pus10
MTAQQLQYLKDTQEKAEKVISSCTTIKHFIAAKKYYHLLACQYDKEFNLSELFEVNPKDCKLCNDILNKLDVLLDVKRRLIKIK